MQIDMSYNIDYFALLSLAGDTCDNAHISVQYMPYYRHNVIKYYNFSLAFHIVDSLDYKSKYNKTGFE